MATKTLYVAYDDTCKMCTSFADTLSRKANGKIVPIGLTTDKANALLSYTYPSGHVHQPYLIIDRTDYSPRAYAGRAMVIRLGAALGPRRAWTVFTEVREFGMRVPLSPRSSAGLGRSTFIARSGAVGMGLFMAGLERPLAAFAAWSPSRSSYKDSVLASSSTANVAIMSTADGISFQTVARSNRFYNEGIRAMRDTAGGNIRSFAFALTLITGERYICVATESQAGKGPTGNGVLVVIDPTTNRVQTVICTTACKTVDGWLVSMKLNGQIVSEGVVSEKGEIVNGWVLKNDGHAGVANQEWVSRGRSILSNVTVSVAGTSEFTGASFKHDVGTGFVEPMRDDSKGRRPSCDGTGSWGNYVKRCMESFGVSPYVATFLVGICGASCIETFGIGCAICAAVAGMWNAAMFITCSEDAVLYCNFIS